MGLDEFEQQNIEEAILWSLKRKFSSTFLFTEDFICELHKRMYGNVWDWAGEFRKTNKNIGVDKWQIPTDLKILLGDVVYWNENNIFSADEITIRFKHRLRYVTSTFPHGFFLLLYSPYKSSFNFSSSNLIVFQMVMVDIVDYWRI